jgi:hypothetical protein
VIANPLLLLLLLLLLLRIFCCSFSFCFPSFVHVFLSPLLWRPQPLCCSTIYKLTPILFSLFPLEQVMRWWEWLPRVNRTCVDAPAFVWLNTVLFHILCPAISIRDPMAASRAAAADWARLLQGKSVMRFSAFFVRLWPAAPCPSHTQLNM